MYMFYYLLAFGQNFEETRWRRLYLLVDVGGPRLSIRLSWEAWYNVPCPSWSLGVLYSASQKKRNREVSMFYHNLITTIINEWYIFGKLRVSSFMWCYSDNAYVTHEWLKAIWRKETKKTFGGRYLNFEEKFTFLESWVSALLYDTSIRKNERGMTKFCLFKSSPYIFIILTNEFVFTGCLP